MKKILSLTLILLLLLPLSSFAEAKAQKFTVSELGLSVEVPPGHYIYTRDIKEGDPGVEELKLNVEELKKVFLNSNIYLNLVPTNPEYEIVLTMIEDPQIETIGTFNKFKDDEFKALYDTVVEQGKASGVEYEGYELYTKDDMKFIVMRTKPHTQGNLTMKTVQYYTIYNGKAYNVVLHSFINTVTPAMESIVKGVVDSIEFNAQVGTSTDQAGEKEESSAFKLGSSIGYILGGVLGIGLIGFGVYKFMKKKKDPDVL